MRLLGPSTACAGLCSICIFLPPRVHASEPANEPATRPVDQSDDYKVVAAMKLEWDRRTDSISRKTKEGWDKRFGVAQRLFGDASPSARSEVISYLGTQLHEDYPKDQFLGFLRDSAIISLLREGKRAPLVGLLAAYCPDAVGFGKIESCLAGDGDGKIDDPVLVLCDSFDACSDLENAGRIMAILRRAFVPLNVTGDTDLEFVKSVRNWYRENKSHVKLNPDYGPNRNRTNGGGNSTLFIAK